MRHSPDSLLSNPADRFHCPAPLKHTALFVGLWLMLTAISFHGLIADEADLPELTGRVVDTTATLSASEKEQLNATLEQLERDTGSQLVVVIVPTTGAEAIEQYSIRLAEEWKIGREGVDDGVILLVAKEDRKLRIEVGYGLEGAIPDAGANRIIDEFIVPEFKRGNFYDGIAAGVDALAILIRGEDLPPPEESADDALLVVGLVFGIMACAFGLIGLLLAFFTHRVWGIILTVVWVSTLLAPLSFLGIIGLDLEATLTLAVFCWIVFSFFIFVLGILVNLGRAVRKSGGSWSSGSSSYSGGSSSYSSSGSSSFSSSSSSSSSSFSGGGGSFGGGGASGSW